MSLSVKQIKKIDELSLKLTNKQWERFIVINRAVGTRYSVASLYLMKNVTGSQKLRLEIQSLIDDIELTNPRPKLVINQSSPYMYSRRVTGHLKVV